MKDLKNNTQGSDVLNSTQTAISLIIIMISSKLCYLPSVIAKANGESSLISVCILVALDLLTAFFAIKISRHGGLQSHSIPSPVRKTVAVLLGLLFGFKFCAFCYEISSATSSSLFDSSVVLPLFVLVTACVVYVGAKGFTGIMRVGALTFWICVLLLLFNFFFVGLDGDKFNLFPIGRRNVFDGILGAGIWFGDTAVLALTDTSRSKGDKKGNLLIIGSAIFSAVIIVGFYLLMIYTYGSAVKNVGSAFSRVLLMNKNSLELGAVDWPLMTVWLIMSFLHSSILFSAFRQCFNELVAPRREKSFRWISVLFYILAPVLSFLLYYFLFKDPTTYTEVLTTKWVSISALCIEYALPALVFLILILKKKEKSENENER